MTLGLTRNGHLSHLSLERIQAHETVDPQVEEHLAQCSDCQVRLQAVMEHERAFVAPPLVLRESKSAFVWIGPALALAAGLLIYAGVIRYQSTQGISPGSINPIEMHDTYRIKGTLNIEFSVKRGETVKVLADKDRVYPGDRIGFRVSSPVDGHLLIVGIDGKNEPYLCYPQQNEGISKLYKASQGLTNLNEAIVLDAVMGQEHIVALFCPSPVRYADIALALKARQAHQSPDPVSPLKKGCRERRIALDKYPVSAQ